MNKKRFKAILASLQILVFSIVQASQVLAVHGAIEQKNVLSAMNPTVEISEDNIEIYSSNNNVKKTVSIAVGGSHSLLVGNDGIVWAWGDNSYGQLGNGTTTYCTTKRQAENLENVVAVSAGNIHSLALKNDGTVWTWGGHEYDFVPFQLTGLNDITEISAGDIHNLALKSDGTVWGWGNNSYGQLGDNDTTEIDQPIQLDGLSDVIGISAGYSHSLFLKSDGTVWALGDNSYGQLGDGTFTDSSIPVMVTGLSDVVSISAGEDYNLALKSDGTVWSWGDNTTCQLGVKTYPEWYDPSVPISTGNTFEPSAVPLLIDGLSDVKEIVSGNYQGFVLKSDGTVWTWGGYYGDLALRGDIEILQVEGISDITQLAAGANHVLAMKSDETVWAWGDNYYGQLGDGTTEYKDTPVLSKDLVPPTAPTNITAFVGEDGVVLEWESSTDEGEIGGYEIYRDNIKIGTTSDTTYTDTDIKDVANYHKYTVKCYDTSGNISEGAVTIINDKEVPSVPLNLRVIQTTTKIVIEWEPSTDNSWVAGYVVFRDGEEVGYTDSTNFTELNLPHNSTYTYTVKAYDSSDNYSEASSPLVVETETIKSVALAAHYNHSLQVKDDGTVWAWGYNNYGQLGDGTTIKRLAAVQVKNLKDIVAVAAGEQFSLALKNDGTVWVWGYNGYGQLGDGTYNNRTQPVRNYELSDIISIEAGINHAIALESDGTVWTWGSNGYGQLGKGNFYSYSYPSKVVELDNVIDVSAGANFSVALKNDGTVWAWGSNSSGQIGEGTTKSNENIPVKINGLTDIIDVKAGNDHVLALKSDGTVWAWGGNGSGQLGNETRVSSKVPVQVKGLVDVVDIGAGNGSSIALKNDGTVWTWGANGYGQLGDGSNTARLSPVQVEGLSDVVDVVMGSYHSLAQKIDGTVWAWGNNSGGRLGDETETDRKKPVLSRDITPPSIPANISVAKSYDKLVLTWDASTDVVGVAGYEIYRDETKIAVTTATTYTDSDLSEINKTHVYYVKAFDTAGNISEAAKVVVNDDEAPSKPSNVKAISNSPTTVSLEWEPSTDNVLVAGYEIYRDGKKIGTSKESKYTDKEIPHNETYTYTVKAFDESDNYSLESDIQTVTTGILTTVPIAAGDYHSLQIRSDGTVWACGYNYYGELGDGTKVKRIEAVQVKDLENIVAVSAGNSYSVALMNNGTVWTWGYGENRQLGNGTRTNSSTPVKVKGLNDVVAIKAGNSHTLALKGDGTVWAWGSNYYGELGNGTTNEIAEPVQVSGLNNIIAISAGYGFNLALKDDGTVYAWGYNYYGQLGDGTNNNSLIPIKVNGLSDVKNIFASRYNSIVLKSDGTVWAWGSNSYGLLGYGTINEISYVPVQVKDLSDVNAIVSKYGHNLALKNDGTVWAWGYNSNGQLGNDTLINSYVPVKVKALY